MMRIAHSKTLLLQNEMANAKNECNKGIIERTITNTSLSYTPSTIMKYASSHCRATQVLFSCSLPRVALLILRSDLRHHSSRWYGSCPSQILIEKSVGRRTHQTSHRKPQLLVQQLENCPPHKDKSMNTHLPESSPVQPPHCLVSQPQPQQRKHSSYLQHFQTRDRQR